MFDRLILILGIGVSGVFTLVTTNIDLDGVIRELGVIVAAYFAFRAARSAKANRALSQHVSDQVTSENGNTIRERLESVSERLEQTLVHVKTNRASIEGLCEQVSSLDMRVDSHLEEHS